MGEGGCGSRRQWNKLGLVGVGGLEELGVGGGRQGLRHVGGWGIDAGAGGGLAMRASGGLGDAEGGTPVHAPEKAAAGDWAGGGGQGREQP